MEESEGQRKLLEIAKEDRLYTDACVKDMNGAEQPRFLQNMLVRNNNNNSNNSNNNNNNNNGNNSNNNSNRMLSYASTDTLAHILTLSSTSMCVYRTQRTLS